MRRRRRRKVERVRKDRNNKGIYMGGADAMFS